MLNILRNLFEQQKKIKRIAASMLGLFLLAGICLGQEELNGKARKAEKNDVIGTWRMTYQTVSPMFMDSSLAFANYQLFEFLEDGTLKNAASKSKMDFNEIDRYLGIIPKGDEYYFPEEGQLIIERRKNDVDNIIILIATEDFEEPLRQHAPLVKKGNLMLSYYDWHNKLYMVRYLEKIE